jgi:hypothetical protein
MEINMKAAIVFVLTLTLVLPALAQAAPPPAPGAVPLTPLREAARRASVALASASEAHVSSQATPGSQRSWPARHPVLLGTLVGIGVGFPVGVATCQFPTAEAGSCDDYTFPGNARLLGGATYGAYGAGIGAAVGALVALATR